MSDATTLVKVEPLPLSGKFSPVKRVSPGFLDRLRFAPDEKPFIEMINIALNRDTLDQVITAVENSGSSQNVKPESQESNAYLAKILREEVQKQFSEPQRPLVELILNGVDARPRDYQEGHYVMQVDVSDNKFEVSDNGKGMNLNAILDTLIVPFNSDKDALVDIGRFGVGFFSNLQYCLQRPGKAIVTVRTGDGNKSYELKVYAQGDQVEDLQCSLRKIRSNTKGTSASVSGIIFKKEDICNYLKKYLRFFDAKRAIIVVNGKPINTEKHCSPTSTVYTVPVELEYRGQRLTQEVRIGIEPIEIENLWGNFNYYSQGVFVQGMGFDSCRVDIDFPSAVQLVEGRDELKQDQNYYRCFEQIARALIQYSQDHQDSPWILFRMREAIAYFARLTGDTVIPKEEAEKACFPTKTYFVDDDSRLGVSVNLRDFFGDEILEQIYIPRTTTGKFYWGDVLPGIGELLKDHCTFVDDKIPEVVKRIITCKPDYVGSNFPITQLEAVRLRNNITRSPVLWFNDRYYVNLDHPCIVSPGFVADYTIQSHLLRQRNGDEIAEDIMIGG